MSTPETPDTVSVTYTGPHAAVYVPGTPDVAKRDEPVQVAPDLAQTLVNQGWTSDSLQPETTETREEPAVDAPSDDTDRTAQPGTETADQPAQGETADAVAGETATAPPAGDETASDPATRTSIPRRR